jgi:glycosyltransferase involved in cell wall biosynthesis
MLEQPSKFSAALISTVYNEVETIISWLDALLAQTYSADELSICDGGSTDGTWEILNQYRPALENKFSNVYLHREKANIARGRNLAIKSTVSEVIACNDAGSLPHPDWLKEITKPLLDNPALDVVGGANVPLVDSDFEKYLVRLDECSHLPDNLSPNDVYPSSRCIAFRRTAFEGVGGYPEWMTLTGEDALFNHNLHAAGFQFHYNKNAVVRWLLRDTKAAYFKMLYQYGYGAAEAKMYQRYFLRRLITTVFPPAILVSKHNILHAPFRYMRNAASVFGWLAGNFYGKRPPNGWSVINGVLCSPETQIKRSYI